MELPDAGDLQIATNVPSQHLQCQFLQQPHGCYGGHGVEPVHSAPSVLPWHSPHSCRSLLHMNHSSPFPAALSTSYYSTKFSRPSSDPDPHQRLLRKEKPSLRSEETKHHSFISSWVHLQNPLLSAETPSKRHMAINSLK
jgi:hypothetical protein